MPSFNSATLRIDEGPYHDLIEDKPRLLMSGCYGRLHPDARRTLLEDRMSMSIDDLLVATDLLIAASMQRSPA